MALLTSILNKHRFAQIGVGAIGPALFVVEGRIGMPGVFSMAALGGVLSFQATHKNHGVTLSAAASLLGTVGGFIGGFFYYQTVMGVIPRVAHFFESCRKLPFVMLTYATYYSMFPLLALPALGLSTALVKSV
eukprot:TRINITY_DN975_c0_g1_i2.p1 TRINITY_DN975_c0_g1~~TRINITY_DN975_c0_g1_i2.p1  ORF type:complete len:133 (+),score=13.25 TRINITY_DN975_c0_g1_i2:69-467(+)